MKIKSFTLTLVFCVTMSFFNAMLLAQSAGDYVAIADGDYSAISTWGISDGNGGTTTATVVPANTKNVWIPEGRSLTNNNVTAIAKDLHVSGTLISGVNLTVTKDITLSGNLYISPSGVLKSTSSNGGSVGTLRVGESLGSGPCVIHVDGQLGSESISDVAGSGFRLFCQAGGNTTVQGNGKINIARFQSGSNSRNQTIIIDMDMNVLNTANNGKTLSLENGTAGTGIKTLVVNAGRTVRFVDNSVNALLGSQDNESMAQTTGNLTYDIQGTVNTGSRGGVKLTTSSQAASSTEVVTLKIGSMGKLIVGSRVITKVTQPTQSIVYDFASGSMVEFASAEATIISAPLISDTQSNITEFSNLTVNTAGGLTLPVATLVKGNLTMNNGKIILGDNNLTVDGAIEGADSEKYIVTNGSGALIQTIPEQTTLTFPVGVTVDSYDPVVLTPQSSTVCSVNVTDVLPAQPVSNYSYNQRVWNVTPVTPSSTVISLTPSAVTATGLNNVIGRYADDVYVHENASKVDNTYSATLSAFSPLVTGANDFGTSSLNQVSKTIFVRKVENHILVEGTTNGQVLTLYHIDGKKLKQINSTDNSTVIPVESGIYLVKAGDVVFKIVI